MPLVIYVNPEVPTLEYRVIGDLLRCVSGDAGLSISTFQPDPAGIEMSYDRYIADLPSTKRVDDIINSSFSEWAILIGVGSSYTFEDGSSITDVIGRTFPPDANGNIVILYDVESCFGHGYYAFDAADKCIDVPSFILLYHELAHFFHSVTGTVSTDSHFQAVTDENVLRADTGLPFRNPYNNRVGCDSDHADECGTGTCFIAGAATATLDAQRFRQLKRVRDFVLRRSSGREWFEVLFREYDQYSAIVSSRMDADTKFRDDVAVLIVSPLLAFFDYALEVFTGHADGRAAAKELSISMKARGVGRTEALLATHAIRGLRRHSTRFENRCEHGVWQPVTVLAAFEQLSARAGGWTAQTDWALLQPLDLVWTALAEWMRPGSDAGAGDMHPLVISWMSGFTGPTVAWREMVAKVGRETAQLIDLHQK